VLELILQCCVPIHDDVFTTSFIGIKIPENFLEEVSAGSFLRLAYAYGSNGTRFRCRWLGRNYCGRWSQSFDHLWQSLQERHGRYEGTRQMIELLGLGKRHGWDRLKRAIRRIAGSGLHGCGLSPAVKQRIHLFIT
jgi:hypothetical protein